jgi:GT2 family glycosyltransferase
MTASVCVTIVSYNSRRYIESCLRSVFEQTVQPAEVIVVDNGSLDGARPFLAHLEGQIRVIWNNDNVGFAAAQNQAIRCSRSDWVLVLNPDVVLEPEFIEHLLDAADLDGRAGTLCGRLLSMDRDLRPSEQSLIDTAGMYFTPPLRHFDRGWHEVDDGRFHETEYVFGASAAAAMYRREMIDDIAPAGEFFDPDFFAYREDADVAWRAQLLGWRCLYVPAAKGYHVRSVGPGRRRSVPAVINMHSVKNRFLMRIKNVTAGVYSRFWLPITIRDLMVVGGCLLWEPTSLGAFWRLALCFPKALRQRRWIMSRRRVSDAALTSWFCAEPASQPAPSNSLLHARYGISTVAADDRR